MCSVALKLPCSLDAVRQSSLTNDAPESALQLVSALMGTDDSIIPHPAKQELFRSGGFKVLRGKCGFEGQVPRSLPRSTPCQLRSTPGLCADWVTKCSSGNPLAFTEPSRICRAAYCKLRPLHYRDPMILPLRLGCGRRWVVGGYGRD